LITMPIAGGAIIHGLGILHTLILDMISTACGAGDNGLIIGRMGFGIYSMLNFFCVLVPSGRYVFLEWFVDKWYIYQCYERQ